MATPETLPPAQKVVELMLFADRAELTRVARLVAHAAASHKRYKPGHGWDDHEREVVLAALERRSEHLDRRDAAESGVPIDLDDEVAAPDSWRPTDIVDRTPDSPLGPVDLQLPTGDRR